MLGTRITLAKKSKDEGEKPFWISYADLMTALMMLFLVVMTVSLLALIRAQETPKNEREDAIKDICKTIETDAKNYGIEALVMDCNNHLISFGQKAQFEFKSYDISNETAAFLRKFVPVILNNLSKAQFKSWLKRVVVEGYTSPEGTYLYNLNLSLQRGQNVLCTLLSSENNPLTDAQKMLIQKNFMVGGFSANSAKTNPEESRRVEFRLEFFTIEEKQEKKTAPNELVDMKIMDVGKCQLL